MCGHQPLIFVTMANDITSMQWRFVIEYCKLLSEDVTHPNATQCAIAAGASEVSASVTASKWLAMSKIKAAIQIRKDELAAAAGITTQFVLHQWYQIATADPADLMQLRRSCCRHCWGFDYNYQWTAGEYEQALNRALEAGKPAPDGMGGFGFDRQREPCPECPECGGDGVESVFLTDTRKLTGAAKKLYAGIEQTQKGLKIRTRNQDDALRNIAKYLGMLIDKQQIVGADGTPMGVGIDELNDAQLLQIVKLADLAGSANDSGENRAKTATGDN